MRRLWQAATCADLVPGGSETVVEVSAGGTAPVASWQDVGPIYAAAAAEDAASPEGPSEYVVELLSDAGSPQAAQAVAGCATTAVVDGCQSAGPAPASIRLRCNNQNRPCSVRVAAYMSPCPGGPQPQQLAEPAGVQSAARPPPANLVGLPSPPPPIDSSSGGVSSTTWVIVGVSAGAALLLALLIWCLVRRCARRRRHRPVADVESGLVPVKPYRPPPQQQQFVVGGGAPLPPYRPPPQQQQAQQAQHVPPGWHAGPAATSKAEAAGWAFAYKLAGGTRRTFATHAGRREGALQEWDSIDEWLRLAVAAQQRWEGCLLYNDQPPIGCPQPAPYKLCAHAKGVLLWSRSAVGWLVHSVPRWPQPPAPGPLVLPAIDAPQTKLSQSFLFVLLPRGQLPAVFAQLRHMQVLVYHASDLHLWPWGPADYTKPVSRGLSMHILGPGLWHIGKANEPHADFYDQLARRFGGSWLVRTNLHTVQSDEGKVPSNAAIQNVSQWAPPGCDHAPYKAGSEHAKLAVCVSQPLVLVGDMNNVKTQHKRGGGGLVLRHRHLAALLAAAAVEVGIP